MVDGLEFFYEHRLSILYVAEGDGALAEVAFCDLGINDTLYEVADGGFSIVGQRPRGGFNAVGHHQAGLFTGEGVGPGIGEQQVIDGFVGVLVLVADVEELGLALSVVGGDEVADDLWQVMLVGHLETLGDVADDVLGGLNVGEHFVRVDARLVFGEINGVRELSDVVVQGTGTHQLGISIDLVGNLTGQIGYLYGMLEGSRGHLTHTTQQRTVGVRELDECDVAGESEGFLNDVQQGIGKEQSDTADGQVVVGGVVDHGQFCGLRPVEGQIDCHGGQRDDNG